MRNRDRRRYGVLKPKLLALFTVVVLLLLIPATANATPGLPAITSPDSYTFNAGIPDTFTIETSGFSEAPSITCEDDLPSGLTFSDKSDRTAIIEGSPDAGTGNVYYITIAASTLNNDRVEQEFALTVYEEAPTILSGGSATFTVGDIYTGFTITTTGYPRPTITCDSLPDGLWLQNWYDGSADIRGPAAAGTGGVHDITITASNGVDPDKTQNFALTVNEAPEITSDNHKTFAMDCSDGFTITTTGYPKPTIGYTGTLPGGLYFDASYGNGTASISGTPDPSTKAGDYPITITAKNEVGSAAPQNFTVTVSEEAPTFTDIEHAAFTVASGGGWFFAYANGYPFPQITCEDILPGGLNFINNGNGSAQIVGIPATGTGGLYSLTITAGNRAGTDTREVALTVNEAPAITNLNIAEFAEGNPGEFTFTTTGYPKPAITSVGSLPNGVSLVDNGNGTATLGGTPAAGTGGVYPVTITAGNSIGSAATQNFYLTVNRPPVIDSEDHCTFTVGTEGTFDVNYFYASGTVCSGDLPSGVIFNGFLGDTYGSFFGTPDPGTGGVYNVTLTASHPPSPDATQAFTLTVNESARVITQPTGRTVNAGQTASFSADANGYPLPSVQWQQLGTAADAVWQDIPGATSTAYDVSAQSSLSGYQYRAVFSNGVGDPVYSNAALLTVPSVLPKAPVITQQPSDQTVFFGQTATFTATANGNPAPTVKWQLSTDRGRHWSDIRGATSLSYTTAPTTLGMSGYLYRAVFRNSVGSVTSDAARLTVNPISFKVLVGTLKWTGPSHGKYQATVSLSITDTSGNPMAADKVKITGVWKSASNRVLGTSSGTTDEHGVLRLSVHELSAQPAYFVVTSATKTGYIWQK